MSNSIKDKCDVLNCTDHMRKVTNPSHSNDSADSNYKVKESEENFDLSSRLHMHQVRFQQGMLKVAHLGSI